MSTTRSEPERRDPRLFAFSLGANLGDPLRQIAAALDALEQRLGTLRVAPIYRTEPVSVLSQPEFLNTVALGLSSEEPEVLLELALEVERRLGRERGERDAPRTIDLDLLFVGDERRRGPHLILPHPRLRTRRFVLAPLADLVPELALPPDGARVAELLAALPLAPRVDRLGPLRELAR